MCPQRLLDRHDLGLDFTDHERLGLAVPRKEIDRATLAIARERHFQLDIPTWPVDETTRFAHELRDSERDAKIHRERLRHLQRIAGAPDPADVATDRDLGDAVFNNEAHPLWSAAAKPR